MEVAVNRGAWFGAAGSGLYVTEPKKPNVKSPFGVIGEAEAIAVHAKAKTVTKNPVCRVFIFKISSELICTASW
jgi:hypothetical protein